MNQENSKRVLFLFCLKQNGKAKGDFMDYIVKMDGHTVRSFSNKDYNYVKDWADLFCNGTTEVIPLYEIPLPKASGKCYPNLRLSPLKANAAMV